MSARCQIFFALALSLLGGLTAQASDFINADFSVTDPADPDFGWTLTGAENSVEVGVLRLKEDGFVFPKLAQSFTLPAEKDFIEIRFHLVDLQPNNSGEFPDALQLSLRIDGQTHQVSLQADGTVLYDPGYVLPGAGTSGTVWSPDWPVDLRFDLSGLSADAAAELEVFLISSDLTLSSVELGRMRLIRRARLSDDSGLSTPYETALSIDVLANDADAEATLDPASLMVQSPPTHGQTVVDLLNGRIVYTPNAGYSGPDSFTYQVADVNGDLAQSAATVTLTVENAPIPQDPLELWRLNAFGASVVGDPSQEASIWGNEADPDGDGQANIIEFFCNRNPLLGEAGPVFDIVLRGGALYLRYRQSTAEGMVLFPAFEYKPSLLEPWAPLGLSAIVVESGDGFQWREAPIDSDLRQGFFRMVVTASEGNPLHAWQVSAFGASAVGDPDQEANLWGDEADPDGDGHANVIEYFANLNPLQASAGPIFELIMRENRLYLRYRRSTAPGMTLLPSFEHKPTLMDPWVPVGLSASIVETADGYQWWEGPIATNLRRGFFRMVITSNP